MPDACLSHHLEGSDCAGAEALGGHVVDRGPEAGDGLSQGSLPVGPRDADAESPIEVGVGLGERGNEFGTTTGRPRRCGWFDAVLVRQAVRINGINGIALTKLDVLDGISELKVCTGYEIGGDTFDHLPASVGRQTKAEPIFEVMEGWTESTRGARSWADLPATAVKYIRRIEEIIAAPVALLSTSPEREDVILVQDPFAD